MLVDITESALVDAPPTTVWALVTDFRRHPDFAGPKSITKAVEFDGPVAPGRSFVGHERFGLRRFVTPSDILAVDPERELRWVSYPFDERTQSGRGRSRPLAIRVTPGKRRDAVGTPDAGSRAEQRR